MSESICWLKDLWSILSRVFLYTFGLVCVRELTANTLSNSFTALISVFLIYALVVEMLLARPKQDTKASQYILYILVLATMAFSGYLLVADTYQYINLIGM